MKDIKVIVCSQFPNIDKKINDAKPKQDDVDLSKETEANLSKDNFTDEEIQEDKQDNFGDANLEGVTPVIADKNENSKITNVFK